MSTPALAFRFRGGRLCLDLIATVGKRGTADLERLRAAGDLGRWFVEAGMSATAPLVADGDLRDARALREALYRVVTAHLARRPPPASDLATVNAWAAEPLAAVRLRTDPSGRLVAATDEVAPRRLLPAIARDAVDLLGGPMAVRVRECEQEDCTLLFVDASRANRRRWCSMDGCGSRSKMAAYRSRRRVD